MRINNNYSSPNFGMALKIKPEAMKSLKKAPMGTLESLEKIGNDLKNTQFCHLEICENLTPKITSPYAIYTGPFDVKQPEKLCPSFLVFTPKSIKRDWIGSGGEFIQYVNKKAALGAYNKIQDAGSELEIAAILTKELDNREIQKQTERQFQHEIEKAKEEKVTSLFDKFGIKDAE